MSDGSIFLKERLKYRIPLDYMIVYGRKRQSVASLLNVYSFDNLIISSDVPAYLTNDLIEEAELLGVRCHSIKENGVFMD